jgi:hypothetical protein
MEILIWETRCLRLCYIIDNNVEAFVTQPLSYSLALIALVCFYGSIKRQKGAHLCCHDYRISSCKNVKTVNLVMDAGSCCMTSFFIHEKSNTFDCMKSCQQWLSWNLYISCDNVERLYCCYTCTLFNAGNVFWKWEHWLNQHYGGSFWYSSNKNIFLKSWIIALMP